MTQQKFITKLNLLNRISVMHPNGTTSAMLNNSIELIHDYHQKDQIIIVFLEDQKRYRLDNDRQLESILNMVQRYVGNGLTERIRKYCWEHLNPIE